MNSPKAPDPDLYPIAFDFTNSDYATILFLYSRHIAEASKLAQIQQAKTIVNPITRRQRVNELILSIRSDMDAVFNQRAQPLE